jgi:hypothetical protein
MWASHRARLVHPTDQRTSAIFDSDDDDTNPPSSPNDIRQSRRRESMTSTSSTMHTPAVVRLEGPYGHASPVFDHDCVLLVAGGVGASLTIGYLEHIVHEATSTVTVPHADVPPARQRVRFVWVVREWSEVQVMRARLEGIREAVAAVNHAHVHSRGLDVDIEIYITRKPPPVDVAPFADDAYGDPLPALKVHTYVRPAFSGILREEIASAGEIHSASESGQTSIAVLGCGAAPVLDALRVAVWHEERRTRAGRGPGEAIVDVDYYEHGYSW